MRFNNLDDWLTWQETLNPKEIDLGLDRVARVLSAMGLSSSFDCPLITVAGTNGKGSVVAMLEAIAMAANLNVCSYTSPHLIRYNERIKINGQPVDDGQLCEAFDRIDHIRINPARINHGHNDLARTGKKSGERLTYFEFGTLAAIDLFFKQQPDLVILEVGLGGRLDAVNVMDADVSVLTSVAIDHVDWLGDDRESIGFEKAGIFRDGKTVICGDQQPPDSVINRAQQLHCEFIQAEQHYHVIDKGDSGDINEGSWSLKSCHGDVADIPAPSLSGGFQKRNAATAILALQSLKDKGLLFSDSGSAQSFETVIRSGLATVSLPGRFQQIHSWPSVYVDVAHNLQAAQSLATQLKLLPHDEKNKTWAIVAMLSDKDVEGVIDSVSACIDNWCFAGLENVTRGIGAEAFIERISPSFSIAPKSYGRELGDEISANQCTMLTDTVMVADTVNNACKHVLSKAEKDDSIIIFGSFYTVAEAIQFFQVL